MLARMKTPTPAILFASVLAVWLFACSGDAGDEAESGADAAVEVLADGGLKMSGAFGEEPVWEDVRTSTR
jgi:hypothetical protein